MVFEGPSTLKLNSLVVESKESSDSVEFDVMEKTLCSSNGVTEKLIVALVAGGWG